MCCLYIAFPQEDKPAFAATLYIQVCLHICVESVPRIQILQILWAHVPHNPLMTIKWLKYNLPGATSSLSKAQ